MKNTFKKMTAVLGAILTIALLTATVSAQCANVVLPKSGAKLHPQAWVGQDDFSARLILASDSSAPVVGMWQVIFTAEGNNNPDLDGKVIDQALVQWHSDGTEIMNSSRAPITQSFCLGVWKRVSDSRYRINHFAISWDPNNMQSPLGPAHIQESVRLSDDGNSYSGSFIIDQLDESGNTLGHVVGRINAKRITVNTPISSLFN
jgi:hypothetical protein